MSLVVPAISQIGLDLIFSRIYQLSSICHKSDGGFSRFQGFLISHDQLNTIVKEMKWAVPGEVPPQVPEVLLGHQIPSPAGTIW